MNSLRIRRQVLYARSASKTSPSQSGVHRPRLHLKKAATRDRLESAIMQDLLKYAKSVKKPFPASVKKPYKPLPASGGIKMTKAMYRHICLNRNHGYGEGLRNFIRQGQITIV
jgi:hypothetical protein